MIVGALRLKLLPILLMVETCSCKHIKIEAAASFDWIKHMGIPEPHESHEVVIAVQERNLDYIEEILLERSTPGSANFQQWMTMDDISLLTRNAIAVESIESWLREYNVKIIWRSRYDSYFKAQAPVSTWETMLNTKFHIYHNSHTNDRLLRASDYSLPDYMLPHINAVFNTCQMPPKVSGQPYSHIGKDPTLLNSLKEVVSLRKHDSTRKLDESWNSVDLDFLNTYYQISSNLASGKLEQSVFSTGTQYFSQQDVTQFLHGVGNPNSTVTAVHGNAKSQTQCYADNSCNEGDLDLEYIMAIAWRAKTLFNWQAGNDPFLSYILEASSSRSPSPVHSLSYSSIEQEVSKSTLDNFYTTAMKLSLAGVTILASSGDNGVANTGCNCDTTNTASFNNCACGVSSGPTVGQAPWNIKNGTWSGNGYFPSFPATCPYVTAVGATMGMDNPVPSEHEREIVCQSQSGGVITSGGGFSAYYPRPSWQKSAVTTYFSSAAASNHTPVPGFNPFGRGYPDLSLIGTKYLTIIGGQTAYMSGTSASCPAVAAQITLINTYRINMNLTTVGWINPSLYLHGTEYVKNDITVGNNKCCVLQSTNVNPRCCRAGFSATVGWDPTTGWGTYDFASLAKALSTTVQPYSYSPTQSPTNGYLPTILGQTQTISYVIYSIIFLIVLLFVIRVIFCYKNFVEDRCTPKVLTLHA